MPGQRLVRLPLGDVRLNFENDTTGGGNNHLEDRPAGLAVRVRPVGGGRPLAIDDVPGWLFSSTGDRRGHEPFGKVDIPRAGAYRVQTTDAAAGGFDSVASRRPAPGTGSGPEVTLGESSWSPLDSALAGAILAGVVVFLALLLLTLPFRLLV